MIELINAEKTRTRCKNIGIILTVIGIGVLVFGWFSPRDLVPQFEAFVMSIVVGPPMILLGMPFLLHGFFKKFPYVFVLAAPIPLILLYIFSFMRLLGN